MEADLWELERGFWYGDQRYYEHNLASQAIMLFPEPVGLLEREEIVHSISEAPRWSDLDMEGQHGVELGPGVVLLSYRATARRVGGDDEYLAQIISVYSRAEGSWNLKYHQQVPRPNAE